MQQEIEATFLDCDHEAMRRKLQQLGAVIEQPKYLMKRAIYDYADLRLDKQAAWIRVREEADKTTMGFKQRQSETIEGMREIEFTISDYDKACDFLEAIGLTPKAVQESKRETWRLGECQIMLDEWPWIPTYVEVEAPSEATVRDVSAQLGLDYSQAVFDSTDAIYQHYFDVTRTEISTVPLAFGPVPEWLESKRR
jgi:adenylate cyclase class 2